MLALCALLGVLAAAVASPAPAAEPATTQSAATIPTGVTIGGIPVGGLPPEVAFTTVEEAFARPLPLRVVGHPLEISPESFAIPNIQRAVERALVAAPGTAVVLPVAVQRERIRAYMDIVANRFDRKPEDAQLYLRKLRPFISRERVGRVVDRNGAVQTIVKSLVANIRRPLTVRVRTIAPRVTRKKFGPVIVIRRGSNKLYLYRGVRYWRRFDVATGQKQYPTPLGRFRVVVKWKNPWWYPPDSEWAKDEEPIPPGPNNPLGTRWMGLSAPGVGIHGTPNPGSIGYSVSHGCIRMRISDAEWLFKRVRVGTTVFIVSA
jgi:lipoprotein-anchoring transpeptidase ErfK/SrfK